MYKTKYWDNKALFGEGWGDNAFFCVLFAEVLEKTEGENNSMTHKERKIFQEGAEPCPLSSSLYYGGPEDMYIHSSSTPSLDSSPIVSINLRNIVICIYLGIVSLIGWQLVELIVSINFEWIRSRKMQWKTIPMEAICIALLEEIGGKIKLYTQIYE